MPNEVHSSGQGGTKGQDTDMQIPAIVMTCQKYAPFVEHMILKYEALWPNHPFCFWLPDGEAMRLVASRCNAHTKLISTQEGEGRGRFKDCVLSLISELDDDAWIYWCIDDKYPVWIDVPLANHVLELLPTIQPEICGISLGRSKKGRVSCPVGFPQKIKINRREFVSVPCNSNFWFHQFRRVKVIRHVFNSMPTVIEQAKLMDTLVRGQEVNENWLKYVASKPAAYYGESTARGKITQNCAASMDKAGMPDTGFERTESKFCGAKPSIFQRLMSH